jgi:hypothetical protein
MLKTASPINQFSVTMTMVDNHWEIKIHPRPYPYPPSPAHPSESES